MPLSCVSPTAQPPENYCPELESARSNPPRTPRSPGQVPPGGESGSGEKTHRAEFASKENSSFCFSVSGSNCSLLVLCTFFYSSGAQGRTVSQRSATRFSAGLQAQS